MRLPLCPGNQGSLDALRRLPQHRGRPAGPILMGLVASSCAVCSLLWAKNVSWGWGSRDL